MKNGLKIYQKEIFNDDFKKKSKRLRNVVSSFKNFSLVFFSLVIINLHALFVIINYKHILSNFKEINSHTFTKISFSKLDFL
jgi:hypothetical protein